MSYMPQVLEFLTELQQQLIGTLQSYDGSLEFQGLEEKSERGTSRPRVASKGLHFSKAAAQFSHSIGKALPPAATERKPFLANKPFQAVAVSWIFHPNNPYVPTTHGNIRFFEAGEHWWFGGGFDLTPFYPFLEDAVHWHQTAKNACQPFGDHIYPLFKRQCDEYFYLPHRQETRGIGGLFFEDWNHNHFEQDFALVQSIANHFIPAYFPIFEKRFETPFGPREKEHQEIRRGRYVEFNLLYDRGTKYGLQSGRRIESVLASMPAIARWEYEHTPPQGSPENQLLDFLKARDWIE